MCVFEREAIFQPYLARAFASPSNVYYFVNATLEQSKPRPPVESILGKHIIRLKSLMFIEKNDPRRTMGLK